MVAGMEHDLTKLKKGIEALNIDITDEQLAKFDKYISLLIQWNKKMNLTAIVEPEEIIVEHFLDSISIFKVMDIEDHHSIIDVGTGAGFPGIPIKIAKPQVKLVLLDSLKKRTEFLKIVAEELNLNDIEVIHSRAEDLAREENYRENFDLVVSRAVASLNMLAEYCIPFVKVGGYFVSYKGPAAYKELQDAGKAIEVLSGQKEPQIRKVSVPFSQKTHKLVIIQKNTKTPKKYPRSPGKIKKSPL